MQVLNSVRSIIHSIFLLKENNISAIFYRSGHCKDTEFDLIEMGMLPW